MAKFEIKAILFLDVDGVLNGHDWDEAAQSNRIRHRCVAHLGDILRVTGAMVVLSSAWRYVIHAKAMTLSGFEYMLRTHGCSPIAGRIIGLTVPDEHCCHCGHKHKLGTRGRWSDAGYFVCMKCGKESTRGDQIARWLSDYGNPGRYVVLDDDDLGIRAAGHPLVQTNAKRGLTGYAVRKAIRVLREKPL